MNNFASRIKNIEARMNNLKTIGLTSSSSLTVAEYTITVHFQIIATQIGAGGEIFDAGASQYAFINIQTKDSQNALICNWLTSPADVENRSIYDAQVVIPGYKYSYQLYVNANDDDVYRLERGETLPVRYYSFKFISTSEITSINITYEDVPIYDGRQP